jgi:hypothetical protein
MHSKQHLFVYTLLASTLVMGSYHNMRVLLEEGEDSENLTARYQMLTPVQVKGVAVP